MRKQSVIEFIAQAVTARINCERSNNDTWKQKHTERLWWAERNLLPRGSGIDCGTKIDIDRSRPDRIVLTMSFHHMDQNGMYDGWTEHTITVRPSFIGRFDIAIGGRDRNGIKDYLTDTFYTALSAEIDTVDVCARVVAAYGE